MSLWNRKHDIETSSLNIGTYFIVYQNFNRYHPDVVKQGAALSFYHQLMVYLTLYLN